MTAAMVIAGLYGFSAALFGSLLLVDKPHRRNQRKQIKNRRPVPIDSYPFASEQEQAALYVRFWEVVGPLRDSNAPVVPGDGGDPQWTS